ncbi:hypothetical protein L3V83_13900 [Thiotrichales bacterium 19X7-9]|nr:hypothetical protein [Thiotrichales bacterium 19X7-9]
MGLYSNLEQQVNYAGSRDPVILAKYNYMTIEKEMIEIAELARNRTSDDNKKLYTDNFSQTIRDKISRESQAKSSFASGCFMQVQPHDVKELKAQFLQLVRMLSHHTGLLSGRFINPESTNAYQAVSNEIDTVKDLFEKLSVNLGNKSLKIDDQTWRTVLKGNKDELHALKLKTYDEITNDSMFKKQLEDKKDEEKLIKEGNFVFLQQEGERQGFVNYYSDDDWGYN